MYRNVFFSFATGHWLHLIPNKARAHCITKKKRISCSLIAFLIATIYTSAHKILQANTPSKWHSANPVVLLFFLVQMHLAVRAVCTQPFSSKILPLFSVLAFSTNNNNLQRHV